MSIYKELLKEICNENKIKITSISQDWVHILEKEDQIHYIVGYHFDLNDSAIATILDDKYAFYELMLSKDFPIIKHHIIHANYDKELVKKLFFEYHEQIVVKANLGSCGRGVFYCSNLEDLYNQIDKLLIKNYSISICPFIKIKNEYRVVVLNNHVELIYGKVKPQVMGDGKKTIAELLTEFNPNFFAKKKNLSKDILPKGKVFEYTWKFNLAQGANVILDIDSILKKRLETLAIDVAKNINIKFASIDIILDEDNNLYLMEANSGVMMDFFPQLVPDGKKTAKNIYEKAIKLMFKE